ncbi:MAG: sn-glycerol-3-phosphate ABC transporter ATP-binding protein UgpC [Atopostipes suicloacalis]|nr:sn-glycerol-3-phosphate ABC transporter ATP-binding protein UgpC [Atopostipes suicloacalis]MDN6731689.1 sn-glycerol-3-phosphate ABC transporter ATP-binding protein UgpC [Atopostipes suicloacalis]
MTKIQLNGVHKQYDGMQDGEYAVTDFNVDIDDSEFVVIVGPSGCGKSTALRMVAGLEEITSGELVIDGEVMNDVAPKDRGIAMVFQNYALYPHMTVYDNMAFGLKLRKYDKEEIDNRVTEASKMLGLDELLDRKPSALSGGQRQRVALGRAVVRDARVFLMDEPLSNLDAKLRVQMRKEIAELHQRLGTNTIYVTHDQTEAMTMADRIVIMNAGFIQQVGTPQEVYDNPVNVFVGSFIGSPAMNFFDVKLENGRVHTESGIDLPVSPPDLKKLEEAGYDGKELIFGIRPEDIHDEEIAKEAYSEAMINAKIPVSEMLGAENILYAEIGDTEFVARVDTRQMYPPNADAELAFNMTKAHYFDKESENVIR